jgi:hypothetical protein
MELEVSLPCSQQPKTGSYPIQIIQSENSQPVSLTCILILSSYLHIGLPSVCSLKVFRPNCCMNLFHICVLHARPSHFNPSPHTKQEVKTLYEGVFKSFRTDPWSESCRWYSSLPLGTVVSLFCESV